MRRSRSDWLLSNGTRKSYTLRETKMAARWVTSRSSRFLPGICLGRPRCPVGVGGRVGPQTFLDETGVGRFITRHLVRRQGLCWLHRTSVLISTAVSWVAAPDHNIMSSHRPLAPADERSSHDRSPSRLCVGDLTPRPADREK